MFCLVARATQHFKVPWTVISAIAVNVMNLKSDVATAAQAFVARSDSDPTIVPTRNATLPPWVCFFGQSDLPLPSMLKSFPRALVTTDYPMPSPVWRDIDLPALSAGNCYVWPRMPTAIFHGANCNSPSRQGQGELL